MEVVSAPSGGATASQPAVRAEGQPSTRPRAAAQAPAQPRPQGRLGHPYDVIAGESTLVVLVYRAGPLARAGHDHLIASHDLGGTIYVPSDVMRTSFEVTLPVAGLTVDDATLRARQGGDFAAEVPDSARQGTRRNMLSEAVLDAERFVRIVVRSEHLEAGSAGETVAHVLIEVRQRAHPVVIPVHYELTPREAVISGELSLKQSDLGLTPFSALLGALQVQDEMRVRFRLVARPSP